MRLVGTTFAHRLKNSLGQKAFERKLENLIKTFSALQKKMKPIVGFCSFGASKQKIGRILTLVIEEFLATVSKSTSLVEDLAASRV